MMLHTSKQYWDQRDLVELLALDSDGQNRYRSHACDIDAIGGIYGGQLIAQALWAAAQSVKGRSPSMLQVTFLQEAHPLDSIEYSVELLQDDRHVSNRHVYGVQGTGLIFSAHATFQQADATSGRSFYLERTLPTPESLPALAELVASNPQRCESYQLRFTDCPVLDVRPIHDEPCTEQPQVNSEIGYWIRLNQSLPHEGCLHQAALAYMSACWLSRSLAPSFSMPDTWQHYSVSNLNHSLWFHSSQLDANDWLLFLKDPDRTLSGHGLATTRIYQRNGLFVASMVQDVLVSRSA
jgi:acyl-CoA thioesterase-2